MTLKMFTSDALAILNEHVSDDGEYSLAKGIPIAYLVPVRKAAKLAYPGHRIRVRFRGPRNHPTDNRPATIRQSVCLKQFATTFAVYID
jgi:hypothetical protein